MRAFWRAPRERDGGQALPLAAAMVGLTTVALLAFVPVGAALDRRTRARTAADAAALAGAVEGERAARRLAEANGGTLVEFEADGDRVMVEVRIGDLTAYASARARARLRGRSPVVRSASGGLTAVSCPTGGSVTVAGAIAQDVRGLLGRAGREGVPLCGWGYRDPQRQIELRREHCGTSDYAVYEMPASHCSPPTARPGQSMHEQGLAIDFTCDGGSIVAGGPCDVFLKANADDYGLFNLPSEIWHYSVNGR
jgi:hypothetical protein